MFQEKISPKQNGKAIALQTELQNLKEANKELKKSLYKYEKILLETRSVIFICNVKNVKVLWSSNNRYFKNMFGEELLNFLDIENLNFIKFIHPEDRELIIFRTTYFIENIGDNFSIIFRVRKIDNSYKWLYLKVNLCKYLRNEKEPKCLCMISEFDESFFSKHQIEELNKGFLREKNNGLIKNLTEKELKIAKYITQGKKHKEIQQHLGFKDISSVNNLVKSIFLKTGATNSATLAFILSSCGIIS
jgi:DNA-binding CsgD family transcriptional regulator